MTEWTMEQRRVITERGHNMIVSAAAGSGKTAVLVERILQLITDEEHPIDIDEIVVVTFTKAAAAEMRDRVLQGILKRIESSPNDLHLQRQATLVHSAFITTIDSFCSYIVRNYFYEIDLDPSFRVGDEGEMRLLKEHVMADLLEAEHAKARETGHPEETDFYHFLSAYATSTSDASVGDMVRTLFEKSESFPWPDEFLDGLVAPYDVTTVEELVKSRWFCDLIDYLRQELSDAVTLLLSIREECQMAEGSISYSVNIDVDLQDFDNIISKEDDIDFYNTFRELEIPALSRKKDTCHPDFKQQIRAQLTDLHNHIKKLKKSYAIYSIETVLQQQISLRPYVVELIRLTKEYRRLFAEAKRDRNLIDFSDLEHFALQILEDEKTKEPSRVAIALSEQFHEIMIDEYQDSNYIQEEILSVISGESRGVHNRFMVGDVKQSIYSFRQAQPDIFVHTYEAFDESEDGVVIDLQKNFRSRSEVLEGANAVFERLMKADLGGVEYDSKARLNYGADAVYGAADSSYEMQLLLVENEQQVVEEMDIPDEGTNAFEEIASDKKIAREFYAISYQIKEIVRSKQIVDHQTHQLRLARYSDIVILMRAPNRYADDIISALEAQNIPARVESKQGYFSANEVQVVLSLLRVLDNPYQDIALVAVLHSAIFNYSNDDLARLHADGVSIYDSLLAQAAVGEPKAKRVIDFIDLWRGRTRDLPIHLLIERLLDETGYLHYVSLLPRGENRRANLEKLVDEAVAYENTSYKGLFHFVRYIERLQKYDVEQGEASVYAGNDDAITLMSIHQSKGLEFPIVILAGACRSLNMQDLRENMVLDATYGIGLDYVDIHQMVKYKPLCKAAISLAVKQSAISEEMRILYVAMTRAKEQLYIVGTIKDAAGFVDKHRKFMGDMTMEERLDTSGYLSWILRATADQSERFLVRIIYPEDIDTEEIVEAVESADRRQMIESRIASVSADELDDLDAKFSYSYPYAVEEHYKMKYSVSEIKHQSMEQMFAETDYDMPAFVKEEHASVVPLFISKKDVKTNLGAYRGTAMHRFMECYDFASEDGLFDQLQRMITAGFMTSEQADLLSFEQLETFLKTDVATLMRVAELRGDLFREKPFVMHSRPADLFADASSQDYVLVQGIIDAYWTLDGKITLLDYKTDRVRTEKELVDRYQTQLALYADALSRALDLPVKEILIYSFTLNTVIRL